MDEIFEGILDVLFEAWFEPLWDFVFYSEDSPKWVRTMVYLLITQAVTVVLACIGLFAENIHEDGRVVLLVIAALWCIGTLLFGFYKLYCKKKKS